MTDVRGLGGLLVVVVIVLFFPSIAESQKSILPKACVDCHGSETKYPVRGIRAQYMTSGHKTIGNASYANSGDCMACHTNEGFIEFTKKGKVDPKKIVSNPSEIGCFTCHGRLPRGEEGFCYPETKGLC